MMALTFQCNLIHHKFALHICRQCSVVSVYLFLELKKLKKCYYHRHVQVCPNQDHLVECQLFNIIIKYFILYQLRQKKTKQTNKQKERTLAGTPQQLWPIIIQWARILIKNQKKEILKNTAIQKKLQLHTTSY